MSVMAFPAMSPSIQTALCVWLVAPLGPPSRCEREKSREMSTTNALTQPVLVPVVVLGRYRNDDCRDSDLRYLNVPRNVVCAVWMTDPIGTTPCIPSTITMVRRDGSSSCHPMPITITRAWHGPIHFVYLPLVHIVKLEAVFMAVMHGAVTMVTATTTTRTRRPSIRISYPLMTIKTMARFTILSTACV
jgi:hypothetical protein